MKRMARLLRVISGVSILLLMASGACFGAGTYSWSNVTGTMYAGQNLVTGTATLQVFGLSFPMTYSLSSGKLTANGSWSGVTTGWKPLPNVAGAEYRVSSPRMAVLVSSAPATLNGQLSLGSVEVRTTGKYADGTPWGQVQLSPPQMPVSFGGDVILNLQPGLPAPQPIVINPFCDASCGFLNGVALPGSAIRFDGRIAVPAGTVFPNGRLDYVNRWHSQCEIHRPNWKLEDEGTGECKSDAICLPGQNRVQGNDPVRCLSPVPAIPQLPNSITINLESLLR